MVKDITSLVINHLATATKHQIINTVSQQLPSIIIKLLQVMATANLLPSIIINLLLATDLLVMAPLPLIMVHLVTTNRKSINMKATVPMGK